MNIRYHIRNLKLQKKILLSNIVFSVIPCLFLMAFLLHVVDRDGNRRINQARLVILNQIDAELDQLFYSLISGSDFFYTNPEVNRLISRKEYESEYERVAGTRRVRELLRENRIPHGGRYYCIGVFGENGTDWFSEESCGTGSFSEESEGTELSLVESNGIKRGYPDYGRLKEEDWYGELAGTGSVKFLPGYRSREFAAASGGGAVHAVRMIRNLSSGREIGMMDVRVPSGVIAGLLGKDVQEGQEIALMDEAGRVIAGTDARLVGKDLAGEPYYHKLRDNSRGYFPADVGGKAVQLCFVTNRTTGWKTVMFLPGKSGAWSGYPSYFVILGVGAVFLLLAAAMSVFNARCLSRPVRRLKNDIERIYEGNLSIRTRVGVMDEFGELGVRFNEMMDRIQLLIGQLKERDEEKRVLELQALQAQINPHFLYNTLASIRFLVEMNMEKRAAQSLLALAKLLKRTFSDHRRLVPLREEMQGLENYLILMENRYQDAFTWRTDMDDRAADLLIPRVSLQPLAENAIAHGLGAGGGAGNILVEARKDGDLLILRVSDNGAGGDPEQIREILEKPSTVGRGEQVSGIGIRNVHERIRLIFGTEYGLAAEKAKGGGICIVMTLPAWEKERAEGMREEG